MLKPEVLSPAGSRESLEAAVRSGADAVYLGATQFSARRSAENFNEEQLKEAVAFCHKHGVKVYQTLNILLFDRELDEALAVAEASTKAGVDAFILQDLGFARRLHRAFPSVPIHASTQLSVHSAAALKPLKEYGFCRVVAAREMSKKELELLCRAAEELDMTVEVFVHGALCMSVSGQCLLSAVLGGRSGNRGLCAGPCRLPFAAEGGNGYDLSLKDLCLLDDIDELKKMGVASFKIEGRMKRPEYVAAATAAYRLATDGEPIPARLLETLAQVFSRSGFTDGYYTEHRGYEMFGIRTKEDVAASNEAFSYLHELYRGVRQSVPISVRMTLAENTPATLSVSCGDHSVSLTGPTPSAAQNRPLDRAAVETAVCQTGGTPYYVENFELSLGDGLFLRAAELKELRRAALCALDEARSRVAPPQKETVLEKAITPHTPPEKPVLIARFSSKNQLPQNLSGLSGVLLPLEEDWSDLPHFDIPLGADIPRGAADDARTLEMLLKRKRQGAAFAYCGNLSAVHLSKRAELPTVGGLGLNVTNRATVQTFYDTGLSAVTLSAECRLSEALNLSTPIPKGIFAYGKLPLMLTRNCPVKTTLGCGGCQKDRVLTDRKNLSFPVACRNGFSEVLNPLPVWLADRLQETVGLDYLLLWFTDETPHEVARIITAYQTGATPPESGHTRGLLYRAIL